MTIWRKRIACRIPKATNTNSEYVTLFPPIQQWFHEGSSTLCYTYFVCLVVPVMELVNNFHVKPLSVVSGIGYDEILKH